MLVKYFVVLLFSTFTLTFAKDELRNHQYRGHILKNKDKFETTVVFADLYEIPSYYSDDVIAKGAYNQTYNVTGWSVLEIKTSEKFSNIEQAYAAGLLEGSFTQELTNLQWQNTLADLCTGDKHFCKELKEFFQTQLNWVCAQIDANPNDDYWHQVNLILVQLNGLIDGYENKTRGPRKEIDDPLGFFLFQTITSLDDLAAHLGFGKLSRGDHCSALIKILPDYKDIFVSHATWDDYGSMLKILKRYTMPFTRTSASNSTYIPGFDTIFSSYPGSLQSIDDFYMTRPTNLTVVETTLDNYNDELYNNLKPTSVPEWIRVIVANRLANSGSEWVNRFFNHNDGTYNNEWMVADFKQFTPGQQPRPGFLTVAEQLTTYYESADMTVTLNNNGYWASYNNIYFPFLRNISGEEARAKKKGPELHSWYNSSRARIFRRDNTKVVDLTTMLAMMRYNDFQHDELSKCDCTPPYSAELTIAARGDLNDKHGDYPEDDLGFWCGGATDAKITSYELMKQFKLVAVAGPTTNGQTPFVWSESDCSKKTSHFGQPNEWNFEPMTPTWKLS